jgi:hypothetical protein
MRVKNGDQGSLSMRAGIRDRIVSEPLPGVTVAVDM